MNKQEIIDLINKLANMSEADFKAAANAIAKLEYDAKLAVFESACRLVGQAEHAVKKRV
jgi:hypothetical protein